LKKSSLEGFRLSSCPGQIGEESRWRPMKRGAADYLLQDRLASFWDRRFPAHAWNKGGSTGAPGQVALRAQRRALSVSSQNIPDACWIAARNIACFIFSPAYEKYGGRPARVSRKPLLLHRSYHEEDRAQALTGRAGGERGEISISNTGYTPGRSDPLIHGSRNRLSATKPGDLSGRRDCRTSPGARKPSGSFVKLRMESIGNSRGGVAHELHQSSGHHRGNLGCS